MPYHDSKKTAGNIFKEIIVNDEYRLRPFIDTKPEIATIVDIGANHGFFSIYARCLFPNAVIHAIEPDKDTFASLCNNVDNFNINVHRVALGDGSKVSTAAGVDQPDSGSRVTVNSVLGDIPSFTLADLFISLAVDMSKPFIIKIDCEGAEKFILGDQPSEEVIAKSTQTMMELHIGKKEWPNALRVSAWTMWIQLLVETEQVHVVYQKIGKKLGKVIFKGLL